MSTEAEEKADKEQKEGGRQEASVIPAQEAQSTASRSPRPSNAGTVHPDEKSILKLQSIIPQSFINELNVLRSQRKRTGENFSCQSELSWMNCLSAKLRQNVTERLPDA